MCHHRSLLMFFVTEHFIFLSQLSLIKSIISFDLILTLYPHSGFETQLRILYLMTAPDKVHLLFHNTTNQELVIYSTMIGYLQHSKPDRE